MCEPLRRLKTGNMSFGASARIACPECVLCRKSSWTFHGELNVLYSCLEGGNMD